MDPKHDCGRIDGSVEDFGLERLQLSQADLQNAKVVAQIDDKFICCAIPSREVPHGTILVLVDQHAADERVRVERFLRETLEEFKDKGVASTLLEGDAHMIQISKEQGELLANYPKTQELLRRWGFRISSSHPSSSTGCTTISVNSVPTLLISRLGAKGIKEVTKIVSGYIAFLQTQPIASIASLISKCDRDTHAGLDATGLLRWMPRRMKDLIDSKACRGECLPSSLD